MNDTLVFERLFRSAFAVTAPAANASHFGGIAIVFADKGYDAEGNRDLCRSFGADLCIHKRRPPHGSGLGGHRWPVERSDVCVLENRRLALRYDRLGFIVQSLLQTACLFLVTGRLVREF